MEQEWAAEREREAEAARQREQEAAQQRDAELRRAQEVAEAAERELVRQREAAAAELEREAAAKKAKKLEVHPDVQRFWDEQDRRVAGLVPGWKWMTRRGRASGRHSRGSGTWRRRRRRWRRAASRKRRGIWFRCTNGGSRRKKGGLVNRILSARREAAAERQAEQDKKAWETSRPEREAAERERRAWIIENDPNFAKISVLQRRGMVARWDEQFPPPKNWIESPAARENRIAQVARRMKLSAFDMRTWELEEPKREAMVKLERAVARQQASTRDPGPSKDYDWQSR